MKKKPNILWLFLMPLIVPAVIFGRYILHKETPLQIEAGSYHSDAFGERASLNILSNQLRLNSTTNVVTIRYFVTVLTGPKRGTSIYQLSYSRRDKELTKFSTPSTQKSITTPPLSIVWANVETEAIDRIAAPVKAMRSWKQIEAYKGGNLSELSRYGATVKTSE